MRSLFYKKSFFIIVSIVFMSGSNSFAQSMIAQPDSTADSTYLLNNLDIQLVNDSSIQNFSQDSLPHIDKMPEFISFTEPEYPLELVKKGIEGRVVCDVIVNDSGTVDSVAVTTSSHPLFDSNVVKAVRAFRFSPAIAEGKPISVLIQYEKKFSISEVVKTIQRIPVFTGTLLEKGTRVPIQNALVALSYLDTVRDTSLFVPFDAYIQHISSFQGQYREEDNIVTMTDSTGTFTFYSLPAGTIEITAPVPGYEEFRQKEKIFSSEEMKATYYLKRISYSEYEIVVYGKAEEKKEVSRRRLELAEVKKIAGFGGDAVRVIQALPGVARPTFGSSQIIVRGSNTEDSQFFLDGIQIPILFHYGFKSTYNSDALEAVNFYPGAFSSRYGNAIAGVVDIIPRKARKDAWKSTLNGDFFDYSVLSEGSVSNKVSLLISGRRSFIGNLIGFAANVASGRELLTLSPYYWDYVVRADLNAAQNHQLYASIFGVKEEVKLFVSEIRGGNKEVDNLRSQLNYTTMFHMGLCGWDWTISPYLTNSFRNGLVYLERKFNVFGMFANDYDLIGNQFRNQLTYAPFPSFKLNIGADVTLASLNLIVADLSLENSTIRDTTNHWLFGDVAGYVNCEWKPFDRLLLVPGIREDYYPELDYKGALLPPFWDYTTFSNTTHYSVEPSVRVFGRYELVKNHAIKGSLGNYSETPKPLGNPIHKIWGNPNLSATRAAQYVAGYEWQISDLVSLDIQGYYNSQWRRPRRPTTEEILQGSHRLYVDNGLKKVRGVEIMLRHEPNNRFFGWIAYSLSRCLVYNYSLKKYILFNKDQTHNLIIANTWFLPTQWDIGFKLQFTSGDPETPVVGFKYNENTHRNELIYGELNASRLPPSFQIDLRVDKKFIYRNFIVSGYIDFFNIAYFAYKSPQVTQIDLAKPYDYKTKKPVRKYIYQYSIPSLGIKAEF